MIDYIKGKPIKVFSIPERVRKYTKVIRIKVNKNQNHYLWKCCGGKRFFYNWYVSQRESEFQKAVNENREFDSVLFNENFKIKVNEFIKNVKWANELPHASLKYGVEDAKRAYGNYFRTKNNDRNLGKVWNKPKLKHKNSSRPSFKIQNDSIRVVDDFHLKLPKDIGIVKLTEKLPPLPIWRDHYYTTSIIYDGKFWCFVVTSEAELPTVYLNSSLIKAVHLSMENFVVTSDNETYLRPSEYRQCNKWENKVKLYQSLCDKRSKFLKSQNLNLSLCKNYNKLCRKRRLAYRHLGNFRKNIINCITNDIIRKDNMGLRPRAVIINDFKVMDYLTNNTDKNSLLWASNFYEIRRQLEYKCFRYGIQFVVMNNVKASKNSIKTAFKMEKRFCKERDIEFLKSSPSKSLKYRRVGGESLEF